jgi:hypothetical protein
VGVFVSYSSRDRLALDNLVAALRRTQLPVWVDEQLGGGEAWWNTILEQIRGCEVFIVALSRNYLGSKPCLAELGYAQELGRPVLPVQIVPVNVRVNPLGALQVIDYQNPTVETGIELIMAVQARRGQVCPLPEPLPEPPPVPFAYLIRLAATMAGAELSPAQQLELLSQLRAALDEDGQDLTVRRDIAELLTTLRDRPDITWRTRTEVDNVLASIDSQSATPAPSMANPALSTSASEPTHLDDPGPITPAPAARQQPADLHLAATQHPPPGRPPVPPPRSADRRPPQADGQRPRRQLQWPLIAATVVIVAAVGITGYLLRPNSPAPQTPTTPTTPPAASTTQAAPPAGPTTQPGPPPGLAPFARTWRAHTQSLVIDTTGTAVLTYTDIRSCASCSMADAPRGTLDFTLTSVSNGVASGTITASSDAQNYPVGEPVTATLTPGTPNGQLLQITFGGEQKGSMCDSTAEETGQCGA